MADHGNSCAGLYDPIGSRAAPYRTLTHTSWKLHVINEEH